jgi:polysulfide reductase chain C
VVTLASIFYSDQMALIMGLKVISGIFALCVATYTGFVLNNVKGVPFWDLSLLPLLFVTCGILGGFGLTVGLALFVPGVNMEAAETGSWVMLIINVLLIAIYLLVAAKKEAIGKQSVLFQIRGGISPIFWTCVVSLGLVIPAAIAVYSLFSGELTPIVLILGVFCEIIGGAMLRYCVLKSGMYNPLIPRRY